MEQLLSVILVLYNNISASLGQSASLHRSTTWVHRKTNALV